MTMTEWPAGLLTALVTPLRDDQIDVDVLHVLIDRQVAAAISGVLIGGGTGEFGALDLDERRLLAVESVRAADGRTPVIVQTGTLATRDAIALSQHAESAGASAVMVASPFGEAITWPERVQFYKTLTAEVGLPVMIYNTPPSGLLTLEQIQELATLPNVSAVKDSSGSVELMGDLIAWAPPDFGVYIGLDSIMYEAISGGARGAVFGTGNLIPEVLGALVAHLREHGVTAVSRELWRTHVRPFLRYVERAENYVALVKAGLNAQGFAVGDTRAPFLMPAAAEVDGLLERLDDVARAFAASPLSAAPVGV